MAISVTFWGVRGSIATPGPDTVEFGGNTSCVEVVCGERRIVLDTGTGMRLLGQRLLRDRKRVQMSVFYSHMHWDHIQGLPFFTPMYMPGTQIDFHGMKGLQSALLTQMSEPGFPVSLGDLPSQLSFNELAEGARVRLDDETTVTCARLWLADFRGRVRLLEDRPGVARDLGPSDEVVLEKSGVYTVAVEMTK